MKAWRAHGSRRNLRDTHEANTYNVAQAQHARAAIRMFAQSRSKSTVFGSPIGQTTRSIFGLPGRDGSTTTATKQSARNRISNITMEDDGSGISGRTPGWVKGDRRKQRLNFGGWAKVECYQYVGEDSKVRARPAHMARGTGI